MKRIRENIIFIIVLVVSLLLFTIKLPYYVMAPGGIINVTERTKIENANSYEGSINLLYVSEYDGSIISILLGKILKNWDVYKLEDIQISNESSEEIFKRNKAMLENANNIATYVAYKKAGKDIDVISHKNIVIGTTKDNGILIGDNILEVEGIKVSTFEEIKEIISKTSKNKINIKVERDGNIKNIEAPIYYEDNQKLVGIVIITNYEYELDPKLTIDFESDEGGSSGGLMTTLSIYTALSNEDIVKGRNISGTGTIDINGNVGEIDGVKYKIIGAVKNDMDVVLVPKDNYEEAIKVKKDNDYDIEIVSIETFNEAIEYLRK